MNHQAADALRDFPEAPTLHARAVAIVDAWKADNGKPALSPEACRDLADRIMLAMIAERDAVRC